MRRSFLRVPSLVASSFLFLVANGTAYGDTFGTDPNHVFEIEFVTIGDPGNLADTTGDPNPAGA